MEKHVYGITTMYYYELACTILISNNIHRYKYKVPEPKAHRRAYSIPMLQRPSSVRRRSQFQRSSLLKPQGQSKPNFMWSILRKRERTFV